MGIFFFIDLHNRFDIHSGTESEYTRKCCSSIFKSKYQILSSIRSRIRISLRYELQRFVALKVVENKAKKGVLISWYILFHQRS